MNIPLIRKDDPRASMPSRSAGNSRDELLQQLAERARTQRLRHQLERIQQGIRAPRPSAGGDGVVAEPPAYSRPR